MEYKIDNTTQYDHEFNVYKENEETFLNLKYKVKTFNGNIVSINIPKIKMNPNKNGNKAYLEILPNCSDDDRLYEIKIDL